MPLTVVGVGANLRDLAGDLGAGQRVDGQADGLPDFDLAHVDFVDQHLHLELIQVREDDGRQRVVGDLPFFAFSWLTTPAKGATIRVLFSVFSACSWLSCACLTWARAMSMSSCFRPFQQGGQAVLGVHDLGLGVAHGGLGLGNPVEGLGQLRLGGRLLGLGPLGLGDFVADGRLLQLRRLGQQAHVGLVLDLVVRLLRLFERDLGLAQLRLVDGLLRGVGAFQQVQVGGPGAV